MPEGAVLETPQKEAQSVIRMFVWRGSHSKYRLELVGVFSKLFATEIVSAVQSESDGNISLTIFYR